MSARNATHSQRNSSGADVQISVQDLGPNATERWTCGLSRCWSGPATPARRISRSTGVKGWSRPSTTTSPRHSTIARPTSRTSWRSRAAIMSAPLGADFAAYFAPANAVCRPVLIRGKRINLRELNQAKVHFRDRRITIRTERCNRAGNLGRALSTA